MDGSRGVFVQIDRFQFERVVANLIDNSSKYRRGAHGKVNIYLVRNAGAAEITFRDDGIGIAENEEEKIFEKLLPRGPCAEYGKGKRPRACHCAADRRTYGRKNLGAGRAERRAHHTHQIAGGGRRAVKRVLIIGYDRSIAELERDYLQADGIEAVVAENGRTGLAYALEEHFDLIVLDVMLPGMDGFEVCREIRARKEVPVLIVSARRDDADKVKGLGIGADDYIVKPFSPSELVARVRAHIARFERLTNRNGKGERYGCRGLVIDVPARRVYVQDKEAVLKNKEFELLLFPCGKPESRIQQGNAA